MTVSIKTRSGGARNGRILEMVCAAALSAVLTLAPAVASAESKPEAGAPFVPREANLAELPAGAGQEETFYACSSCHALKLVTAQGMTRNQWDDTLHWMTERHNMPKLEGRDRDVILDYLATHFAPKPAGGGRGWTNPFAQ